MAGTIVTTYGIKNTERGIPTTANVSDVRYYKDSDGDKHYSVTIRYTYNDIEIESTMPYYSSKMKEGSSLAVLLNPDDVSDIILGIGDIWIVAAFFYFFAIITIFAGYHELSDSTIQVITIETETGEKFGWDHIKSKYNNQNK